MTGEPTFNTDGLDVDEIGDKVLKWQKGADYTSFCMFVILT